MLQNTIKTTKQKWWVLAALSVTMLMLNIDWVGVNVAIPSIASTFHSGLPSLQWVVNGYVLAGAMFTVLCGRLADVLGMKPMFMVGLIIFTVGSFACGLASSELILIAARITQGLGFAILLPLCFAILFVVFPVEKRGIAAGILTVATGIGQSIGPSLSGLVIHFLSWRWFFLFNVPFGLIALFILGFAFHQVKKTQREIIDYIGAALLSASVFLIILAVNETKVWQIDSLEWVLSIIVGCFLFALFFFLQSRFKAPLIDLSIFKSRNYSVMSGVRAVFNMAYFSFMFSIVLYLQNVAGYSALQSGFILFILTGLLALSSPVAGRLVDRVGPRIPIMLGMLFFALAFLCFSFAPAKPNLWLLATPFLFMGLSTGAIFSAGPTAAFSTLPAEKTGVASSTYFMNAMIAGAIGIGLNGYVLSVFSYHFLVRHLQALAIHVTHQELFWMKRTADGSHSIQHLSQHISMSLLHKVAPIVQQAFLQSFHRMMYIAFGLGVMGLILAAFLQGQESKHRV